ncbi:hypothetical protein QBC38DRAFT_493359 [Podospora fimiseda]|uniref:Secreted protein n=1 Tax=Podospora fimiseda TaxID=252190 RepID=A0AAN6YR20_9PEZI|nr:hypothetical protein QBC38DRAFT_493359 [Podospora fimiseda]
MAVQKPVLKTVIGLKLLASTAVTAAYLDHRNQSHPSARRHTMPSTPFLRGSSSDSTSPNNTCLGDPKMCNSPVLEQLLTPARLHHLERIMTG